MSEFQCWLTSFDSGSVLKKIENVFESVKNDLFNDKDDLSITLKLRTSRAKSDLMLQKSRTHKAPTARSKRLCFPGKTEEEAWRFSKDVTHGSRTAC